MEDKKENMDLFDQLNEQFLKDLDDGRVKAEKKKKRFRLAVISLAAVLILVTGIGVTWHFSGGRSPVLAIGSMLGIGSKSESAGIFGEEGKSESEVINTDADSALTPKEQEKWVNEKISVGEIPIELNDHIEVQSLRAKIRLHNPIYSYYVMSIRILHGEDEDELFSSERLTPGTVLEMVRMPEDFEIEDEETDAVVEYTFYDEDRELGNYRIPVKLIHVAAAEDAKTDTDTAKSKSENSDAAKSSSEDGDADADAAGSSSKDGDADAANSSSGDGDADAAGSSSKDGDADAANSSSGDGDADAAGSNSNNGDTDAANSSSEDRDTANNNSAELGEAAKKILNA